MKVIHKKDYVEQSLAKQLKFIHPSNADNGNSDRCCSMVCTFHSLDGGQQYIGSRNDT